MIEAAANRQMAYMQEVSGGAKHIDEAQTILGELSKARVCLLNDEKKTAYDAALQAGFDSKQQTPTQSNESTPIAETPTDPLMPPQLGRAAKGPAPITDIPTVGQTGKHAKRAAKEERRKHLE